MGSRISTSPPGPHKASGLWASAVNLSLSSISAWLLQDPAELVGSGTSSPMQGREPTGTHAVMIVMVGMSMVPLAKYLHSRIVAPPDALDPLPPPPDDSSAQTLNWPGVESSQSQEAEAEQLAGWLLASKTFATFAKPIASRVTMKKCMTAR